MNRKGKELSIENEELITDWFEQSNIRPGTQQNYRVAMNHYCNLIGKTPTELLEEAEEEEASNVLKRKRKIRKYLLRFIKKLEENGIAPGTVNLYYSAIRSFYKSFDVTLPYIKREKGDITLQKNKIKGLKREEILKLANAASPRERALIYLMALSGMGQQEARSLTIKNLLEAASRTIKLELEDVFDLFKYENEISNKILTLHIRRIKVNYDHHTFIPPEAVREIINYLKERCYGRNGKIRITRNNDFVFVSNAGNPMSDDSVVSNFRRIGQKAGFKKEKGAYSFWRSHSLRKYFISMFINKTGEKILADYLAGHRISEQDRTYWQANPEDLEKQYLKVLPHLTLDQAKVKDVTSDEFDILTNEMKSKDEQINDLVKRLESVESVKNEMEKLLDLYKEYSGGDDESIRSMKMVLAFLRKSKGKDYGDLLEGL